MVLLRGLNYDYSGQQSTIISTAILAAGVTLVVENTEGFVANDYLLFDPGTETSEIVKITTVSSTTQMTIPAVKFAHAASVKVWRLPYNQMMFYESATVGGTYVLIASSTTDLSYTESYTNYDDATGDADYYFKRTFYNEGTAIESDIGLSDYWQASDESYPITNEELRKYLQFDENDYPSPADMNFFIGLAQTQFALDSNTQSGSIQRIAMLMLSKWYVIRGLATRSISKGYITVNAEGRTITKAIQELILEAENTLQEYNAFLIKNDRQEVTSTKFMDDRDAVSAQTEQEIKDIQHGTSNAMQYNRYSFGRARRSTYN